MDEKHGSMINDIYDAPQSQRLQCFLISFCSNLAISVILHSRHILFLLFWLSTIYAQTTGVVGNGIEPKFNRNQESAEFNS